MTTPTAAATTTTAMPTPAPARRRRLALAGVVVLLAVLAGGYAVLRDDAGPLGLGEAQGGSSLAVQDLVTGEPYTYGFMVRNGGDADAVLDRVELVGGGDGATAGPALTAAGGNGVASARGFPPSGLGVEPAPLRGSRVPPGDEAVNVLVRVVVTEPGVHRFSGARLHYAVGDEEYTYDVPDDLMLCSATCPPG